LAAPADGLLTSPALLVLHMLMQTNDEEPETLLQCWQDISATSTDYIN